MDLNDGVGDCLREWRGPKGENWDNCNSMVNKIVIKKIKHNTPKCCMYSSIFNIKMAAQKFTNFDFFKKMHADMTAVTIQSNKSVPNEVQDN